MQLYDEKEFVRRFLTFFKTAVNNPTWGLKFWDKQTQFQMLMDMERIGKSLTAGQIHTIMGTKEFLKPAKCSECGSPTFEYIEFSGLNDEDGITLCRKCVAKAHSMMRG